MTIARILTAIALTAQTRADLSEWVDHHRDLIDGLGDGSEVVLNAARSHWRALQ
jgi:hypothetical protein